MVEAFLLGGKAAFGLVGLTTGIRLWRVARAGAGLGIHMLASAVIFVGGVGLAAAGVAPSFAEASPSLAVALNLGGDLLERTALVGLCVFVWKVFRPAARWTLGLTVGLGLALVASFGWEVVSQPWPHYDASKPSAWGTQLSFALPFVWSAAESTLEWRRGRRKLALGLTLPIAVNRFALWSLACAGFVVICGLAVAVPVAADAGLAGWSSLLGVLRGAIYYAVAAIIWIGMFPPAFYLRRFEVGTETVEEPRHS